MYMERIPTFTVSIEWRNGESEATFRVPKNHLDEFLYVLTFNDWVENFRVEREVDPWDDVYDADELPVDDPDDDHDEGIDADPIPEHDWNESPAPRTEVFKARVTSPEPGTFVLSDSPVSACNCIFGIGDPRCCVNQPSQGIFAVRVLGG